MLKKHSGHLRAVFQAVFVTVLWSSSWVLIKIGLRDIPALTFAGLRYLLAFLFLLPLLFSGQHLKEIKNISLSEWLKLLLLGLCFYSFTQGSIFLGLSLLPAVTVGIILSFTPIPVTFFGFIILSERPTIYQLLGVILFIIGIFAYFYPITFPRNQAFGLLVVVFAVLTNAFSSILGRGINRKKNISPITVTLISMGFGSLIMITAGFITQGLPSPGIKGWLIIVWLALVNTAFAFSLWNHTLRTLKAMESSIINNTMLFQIALLAWIFMGENMDLKMIIGMCIAGTGAIIVNIKAKN